MVLALATENKIALLIMAAIFVAFALASSFLFPRENPNYPGRALGWFVLATIVLFLAMMTTVLVFGKEKTEPASAGNEAPAAQTTTGATTTGETTTGETSTGGTSTGETPPAAGGGDVAAGKQVFTTAGCSGCHTLKAANASGNVGPNLDDAKPAESLIRERVENGKAPMPPFKGQLSAKQIDDVIAFVYSSTHS